MKSPAGELITSWYQEYQSFQRPNKEEPQEEIIYQETEETQETWDDTPVVKNREYLATEEPPF